MASWRTGGDPSHERKLLGKSMYEPLTLEQGLTHDSVFKRWANLINNLDGDSAMTLKNFRKDIVINVLNLQGRVRSPFPTRCTGHGDRSTSRCRISAPAPLIPSALNR